MPADDLSILMTLLGGLPQGSIPDHVRTEVIRRLENCWNELSGSQETNMSFFKLSRAEELAWKPPLMRFKIARHGATVSGSTREHLQHWEVNLEKKIAHQVTGGFRQVYPTAPKITKDAMIKLARQVCDEIRDGPGSNPNSVADLSWIGEAEFRVKPSSLIPGGGFQQTVEGRRKRMRAILQSEIEAIGWVIVDRRGTWLRFRKADTPS